MDLPISVSVLLTQQDYVDYAAERQRAKRRNQPPWLEMVGSLTMIIGLAGWFFGGHIGLKPPAAGCIVALGVFFVLYRTVIAPVVARTEAATAFQEQKDLQSSSIYRFSYKGVAIQSSYIEGLLPFDAVTSVVNTDDLIGLEFGREAQVIVPKKLLSEQEQYWIIQAADIEKV